MKRLFLLLVLFPAIANSATYYVDCNANGDAGAGTGTGAAVAWKTIAKVNSSSFSAGDSVLFNKGCTWREQLTVPSSGSAGSPITFGAYGTGAAPIINGAALIAPGTSWAQGWTTDQGYDVCTGTCEWVSGMEGETDAFTTEWTSKTVNAGNTLTVGTTNVNHGSKNMTATMGGSNRYAYATKTLSGADDVFIRLYVRIDGEILDVQYDAIPFLTLMSGTNVVMQVAMQKRSAGAGGYVFYGVRNPAGASMFYGGDITYGSWYRVEVHFVKDATVGGYQIWVDGTSKFSKFDLDTSAFELDNIRVGASTEVAGNGGLAVDDSVIYVDDVKVDTAAIGAYDGGGTGTVNTWTTALTTQPYAVWFDGTLGTGKANVADCDGTGKWHWNANVLYVYSASDPDTAYTAPGIEASARGTVLIDTKDFVTLENLDFLHGGNATDGDVSVKLRQAKNIILQFCSVLDSVNLGVDIYDPSTTTSGDVLIQNCVFRGTGEAKTPGSSAPSGIQTYDIPATATVTVQNCTFQDMDAWGEHHGHGIYHSAGKLIWRYNFHYGDRGTTEAGAGAGSAVRISSTAANAIYYNVFSNSGGRRYWGMDITFGTNTVYNNVFYGNNYGAFVEGGTNTFKNNIFAGTGTWYYVYDTAEAWAGDNNLFHGGSDGWVWNTGAAVTTIANWRIASSADANSVAADPLFLSSSDFRLQSGSPARAAGIGVGLRWDFVGQGIPTTPDIGAYQFGWVTQFPAFSYYRETTVGNVIQFDKRH